MRVLVTGSSGFIGSYVCRALLGQHDVIALVKPGDPARRLAPIRERISVVTATISDSDSVRELLEKFRPDACIHLAWYAEPGKYLHSTENLASLTASVLLLEELAAVGCKHIVATGTCAEYDTDFGFLREDGPPRPTTLYAAAKLSMSYLGEQLSLAKGMTFAWARVFYPFGPSENEGRVVPSVIRTLHENKVFRATAGEQVRDYIHVEDVASALVLLMERGANGIFNVASGIPITMKEFLGKVGIRLGRHELLDFGAIPYRDWEPMFICGDNRRLRALGWRPRYTLDEGIADTCQWWMSHLRVDT